MTESESEEPLSPREEKFLRALSEGDMRKAARVLGISPATLQTMGPSYLRWLKQERIRDDDARQGLDFPPSPSSREGPPFPREDELAQLLLAGNYSEAAKRLRISEKTVRTKAPYLLETWERQLATDEGAGTPPVGPTNEV